MPRCFGLAQALVQQLYRVPVEESAMASKCDVGRFGSF